MNLVNISNPIPISTTQGQYNVACCRFRNMDSEELTGKLIRLNPAMYCNGSESDPTLKMFEVIYPAVGSTVYMAQNGGLPYTNHVAYITAIDSQTFEVCYGFFAMPDQGGYLPDNPLYNSTFCDSASVDSNICLRVEVDHTSQKCLIPFKMNEWCSNRLRVSYEVESYSRDGFDPESDLKINISSSSQINNGFYVGFMQNNSPTDLIGLVQDYGLDYVFINGSIVNVDDGNGQFLPSSCVTQGDGFQGVYRDGIIAYESCFTISKDCLTKGQCYSFYIVYKDDNGQWRSCKYEVCEATPFKPFIYGEMSCLIEDCFGNSIDGDIVYGLSECTPVTIKVKMDKSSYDQMLSNLGCEGSFDDNFIEIKSATTGIYDPLTAEYSFTVVPNGYSGSVDIVVSYLFDVEGFEQLISKKITLNYGVTSQTEQVVVCDSKGEEVKVLCQETQGIYKAKYTTTGKVFSSINGSAFSDSLVSQGLELDCSKITEGDEVCVKIVEGGDPEDQECECVTIPNPTPEYIGTYQYFFVRECSDGNGNGVLDDRVVRTLYDLSGGSTPSDSFAVSIFGSWWHYYNIATQADYDNNNGDQFSIDVSSFSMQYGCVYSPPEEQCDCPPEEPIVDCSLDGFNFDIDCDQENGDLSISVNDNFSSPIETEIFDCQINNDPSIPCPLQISGLNGSVKITRYVKLENGCEYSAVEVVSCLSATGCNNFRSIKAEVIENGDECTLTISNTDNFESDILTDELCVEVNGILVYVGDITSYTDLVLEDGDRYCVWSKTTFNDSCRDFETNKYCEIISKDKDPLECDYTQYKMICSVDPETCEVSASFEGNEEELILNEKVFCFSEGSKEFEYIIDKPIISNFVYFIWRIQIQGCPVHEIIDYCSIKGVGTNGEPIVNVTVNPIINVECCCEDKCGNVTLSCQECTLCIDSDIEGWSFIVCDSDGTQIGSGSGLSTKVELPKTDTYVIKGTREDCPPYERSYPFTKPSAGKTIHDSNNPLIVN